MTDKQPRIVSLIASATEIVHALGALDHLVGRSHECDFPPSVAAIPALTRPKFKVEGSSREIDQRVKALVEAGLAVYEVDADALRALAPDVILTQDQCEVCAVSLRDVEAAVGSWVGADTRVVSLRPHTVADVTSDILRVGEAIGRPLAAQVLVGRMQSRFRDIQQEVVAEVRPRVAFIEWIDPLMSGGHWMPELITAAGGINLFGSAGQGSPWIALSDIVAADPDVIVVAPCGYDRPTVKREMAVLEADPTWRGLRAVAAGAVAYADGNAFFNRPGPRLIDTLEILAEILHPRVASYGHRGSAYGFAAPTG